MRNLSPLSARIRGLLARAPSEPGEPAAVDPADRSIIEAARPYTMTSAERIQACIDAVRYCERRGVAGAFAECGVWRGGSVLAMILTLQQLGAARARHLPLRHVRGDDGANRR